MSSDSSTVLLDCLWLSFFSQGLKMLLSDAGSYATGEPDQPSPGEHRLKQTVVYLHIQQLHHSTSIHLESQSSIPRVSAQSPPTPENNISLFSCLMLHSVHQLALTVSVCCLLLSRSCSFLEFSLKATLRERCEWTRTVQLCEAENTFTLSLHCHTDFVIININHDNYNLNWNNCCGLTAAFF